MQNYFLLIILPAIVAMIAQFRVTGAFRKWSKYRTTAGMTGAQVAQSILQQAQINDVTVERVNGFLGDHYDPTHKRLCLSDGVHDSSSVAAAGIAAHEVGHAIQHAKAYAPLKWRMAIVPVTQIASQILPFVIMGGFFFQIFGLIKLGIICYFVLTIFQLITLPVEFDASRRAKIILGQMGMIQQGEEASGVNRVLNAAALTYVAAFLASLGNLLYLISLTQRRN